MGGLYLGELVRLTLLQLAEEGVVFGGQLPPSLRPPWTLTAAQITQIERSVVCRLPPPVLREVSVCRLLPSSERSVFVVFLLSSLERSVFVAFSRPQKGQCLSSSFSRP